MTNTPVTTKWPASFIEHIMKTALKLTLGLVAGGVIGLMIGGVITIAFTDTTWNEYIEKYYSIGLSEGMAVFLVAVVSMIISFLVLVPIHELGHRVCRPVSDTKNRAPEPPERRGWRRELVK